MGLVFQLVRRTVAQTAVGCSYSRGAQELCPHVAQQCQLRSELPSCSVARGWMGLPLKNGTGVEREELLWGGHPTRVERE